MKLSIVVLVVASMVASQATASPLACESLHSADARNYCRALTKNDTSYCELIKDKELRIQCRAFVNK